MTLGPSPRRQRLVARMLIGAALVLSGVLAPIETLLPDPLDHLISSADAAAQSQTVQDGVPSPCPAGYTADVDLCRVEQPACPYNPFDSTRLMDRSIEFTEFCEITLAFVDPADPDYPGSDYAACTGPPPAPGEDPQTYPGFAVIVDPVTLDCRMLQLRTCETGTRIDSEWCRATIRRSWTCPQPNAIARNEFNTCYIAPTSTLSTAIACGPGSPAFVIVDCVDYLGNDFVEPPGSVTCGSYDTGTSPPLADVTNAYWCEFDESYLKIVCYSTPPPVSECGPSLAMCLKRGSGTGGCDGIAHTMLCRSLQYDFEQQHMAALADNRLNSAEELSLRTQSVVVRNAGCEPCLILPFEPYPEHCPDDTIETARPYSPRVYTFQAIEQEHDIEQNDPACGHLNTWEEVTMSQACKDITSRCDSPSPGNPVWSSTHFSGLAVVNSSVIVRLHDAPVTFRRYPRSLSLNNLINRNIRWGNEYAEFPGSGLTPSGQIVRTFSRPPSDIVTDNPERLGNLTYECVVNDLPLYKLIVEELWPDRPADAAAITSMFGASALDWWTNLGGTPGARQRLTEARGLPWWPGLTTTQEREQRIDSLKTKTECHSGQNVEVWCRWTPTRSGYFRLKVGGGWLMTIGESRGSIGVWDLIALHRSTEGLTATEKLQVLDTLEVLGCGPNRTPDPSCAWSPAAVGLENDLSGMMLSGFYESPTEGQMFPGIDLRVKYTDRGAATKYTETQPFGVQVHEVRVSTVTPSR